ncbi:MAG: hypothetical protein QOJ11_363 [Frankiales bacterium]|nr:hypothetical protein [Frankiales bacterium]
MTITLDRPVVPAQPGPHSRPGVEVRKFRPDIEGLRTIAVLSVLFGHFALGFPGGYVGVDVFFVISGFLITRQLWSEFASTGKVHFGAFYARRARRILPAATVAIIATVLAFNRYGSSLRVKQTSMDGVFSAISGINWRLAQRGTDYFQSTAPPSPFQHFWSLAVEEQFYLLWPALLFVIGLAFGRKFGRLRSVVWFLALVIAVSLYLSVHITPHSRSFAYFGLHTRAWELALGAFVAITVPVWTKMPPAFASQMSWLGLILIGISIFTFGSSTVYPGSAVILPVVGAALVIMGGSPGHPHGAEMMLKQMPFQFVGAISYSLYLWHWPVLIIGPLYLGHAMTIGDKWVAVAISFALATSSYYLVEGPIRSRKRLVKTPGYGLSLGGVFVGASVITALLVITNLTIPGSGSTTAAAHVKPAATLTEIQQALATAVTVKALPNNVTPAVANAAKDSTNVRGCLISYTQTTVPSIASCTFGNPSGARTLVLVGDSHAAGWLAAYDTYGKRNSYRIILLAKPACPPGVYTNYVDGGLGRVYTECDTWRTNMFAAVKRIKPNVVVVTSQLRNIAINPDGEVAAIVNFKASGAQKVIYQQDNPFPATVVGNIPDCLLKNASDIQKCSVQRSDPLARMDAMAQRGLEAKAAEEAGAKIMDTSEWFCTKTTCPPVVNDIVVFKDDNHLTKTYIDYLTPELTVALNRIIAG